MRAECQQPLQVVDTPAGRSRTERYYFEDMEVGFRYSTSSRTITEADVVAFASYTGDFNRAHVDAEFAAHTSFGQRIAHGMLVASYMAGLNTRTVVNQLLEPSLMGLLEVNFKFPKATFIGDTIRVDIEVVDVRKTSKPDRGIVTFCRRAFNQREEVVVECSAKMLVMCRPVQE
jgi:acyl dehydratase